MRKLFYLNLCLIIFCFSDCSTSGDKELTEEEKRARDSVSRIEQRLKSDSLRKTNPLLIVPPDSTYTGDYTDKYPNGIVKFKGYFRFGERHGQWMSFYPNGSVWSEMHYDKGLREGPNMAYYEGGTLRYTGFYKNDYQDSIWSYYDSTGKIVEKILFKDKRFIKNLPLK